MRKLYHFFFQAFFVLFFVMLQNTGFAQNDLWLTSNVPTFVTVCDSARTFSLSVVNGAGVSATAISVTLHLEAGQKYVAGTLVGAGVTATNISDLRNPVFSVTNFSAGSKPFSIKIESSCDLISATGVSGGQTLQLEADLNYTTSGVAKSYHHISLDYSKKYAALSITNVTNKNYAGNLGNTYTRVISIKNGGYGRVASFTFTTVHTPVTTISAVAGTASWSSNAGTETYTVSNFTSVGNNDNYFDLNEVVTITETVVINQCATPPTTTQFTASWGCNGQTCQGSIESASTSIPARSPIIAFTTPVINSPLCDGISYAQQIRVQNTGTGIAKDFDVDIFRGTDEVGIAAKPDWAAFIETNTITYRVGASGAFVALPAANISVVTTTLAGNSCYGNTKANKVRLRIPNGVAAGASVFINFNIQNGCPLNCNGSAYGAAGWMYNATYKDECDNTYTKVPTVGLSSSGIKLEIAADGLIDLPPATNADYSFNINSYSNNLNKNGTGYWEVKYTLTPNLTWTNAAANVAIMTPGGANSGLAPSSITYAANVVTLRYPFTLATLDKYTFVIKKVQLDCSIASATTAVDFQLIFKPATACSTSLYHTFCSTMSIIPHCPAPCADGMRFNNFSLIRTNYGLPDNTNDGIADLVGAINMSKVKTRYAMQGDTLKATFGGTVFVASSNFDYAYASTDMKGGAAYLTALPAMLTVTRGASTYTCPVTATKTGNIFSYNISPALLNGTGSLPMGFQLEAGDEVLLETYYEVSQNPGNNNSAFLEYTVNNLFYCSSTPVGNGSLGTNLSCDSYSEKYYLLRYYPYTTGNRTYTLSNCNNLIDQTDLYLGLGTCCSNFEGGNLFSSEFRPLAYYDSIHYTIPTGYSFVSAQAKYYYGHGAANANMNLSSTPVVRTVTPTNPGAATLHFDIASLFASNDFPIGDEGHHLAFFVTIKPDCGVASGTATASRFITWMAGIPLAPVNVAFVDTNINQITYTASNFLLSSTNSYQVALQKNVEWEFDLVDLAANTVYPNAFIGFESISGKLSVSQLKDETTNTVITPNAGGVYPLGQLSASHHYKMYVINTGCGLDSMVAKMGWSCAATEPATMAAYGCSPKRLPLYVMKDPNTSEIQILDGTTDNTMEMCTDNVFRVKLLSSKISYVYEPEVSAILPTGMTYVGNSAEILYPLKDSSTIGWRHIDDPTIVSSSSAGQTVKWVMNNIPQEPKFLQRGFPGVLNEDSAEFWIRFHSLVSCDFVGGSVVRYRATGKDLCGQQLPVIFDASSKNKINGMTNGYVADMLTRLAASPNMCSTPKVNVHVAFYNDSPTPTGNNDYYACTIPSGYSYGGNFQIIRNTGNAFPSTTPSQTTLGSGDIKLEWKLPSGFLGTAYMDSIVFSFDVDVPLSVMECGQGTIASRVATKGNANCATAPGGSCTVDVQNASTSAEFDIVRPIYLISSVNFVKGAGDMSLNFTLENIGSVNATTPVTIQLYEDNDNSGGETAGDNLLSSFAISTPVPAGTSIGVARYIVIPSLTTSTSTSFFLKIQPHDINSSNCTCSPAFAWKTSTGNPLPVANAHLVGLAGVKNNMLSLEVSEGINIHSFVLEKLMEDGEWKQLRKSVSDESNFELKRIVWQDTVPELNETYRAGIINIDGKIDYSNLVELSRENVEAIVRVYPNPANDELNLAISIPATNMAHIEVINSAGIMKVNSWQDLSEGLSIVTLDASKWEAGIYFVKVQYGSIVKTHKVVILHQ